MGKPWKYSIGGDGADTKIAFFFGLPFGIAGRIARSIRATQGADRESSLADEEEQIGSLLGWVEGAFGQEWTGDCDNAYAVVASMIPNIEIAMETQPCQFDYA